MWLSNFGKLLEVNTQTNITTMRKIIILAVLGIFSLTTNAQTQDDPWWLNIELTNNKWDYRIWEGMFDFGQLDNSGFRIGVDRYLSKSFDAEFGFSYGKLNYENVVNANLTDFDLRLVYKLTNGYLLKEDAKISPFLFAGFGMSWLTGIESNTTIVRFEDEPNAVMPIGAGLEFKVTEGASITTKASYKRSIVDKSNYMQYSVGVSFSLSRKKDTDGDGVFDKEDACPNEAGPAENKGCPWPDSDNDGVLDKDDACPNEAGTLNGCPDSDRDGIKDAEDACPNVAGIARFNGCPDSDGDGVQDSEDECPNQAGTLNGCPDADEDGVKDADDECPRVAGTLNGCPDADGDGIKDGDDSCPQVAGIAANNGCPEVKEEVKEALELAVKNIQFNSGSDVLKTSSYASLDQVAALMLENTTFGLKLSGHTDNTGNDDLNLDLSKRRAAAVKQYLVNKGVEEGRLSADGYGETQPIADNNTREGRAANRRVELEIVFD